MSYRQGNHTAFPTSRPDSEISVPLSILACTAARFTPTGCIWIFHHHDRTPDHHTLLKASTKLLRRYPQRVPAMQDYFNGYPPIRVVVIQNDSVVSNCYTDPLMTQKYNGK
jgi:hypothetical protein